MNDNQTFRDLGVESFPLCWPTEWKRTGTRKRSQFKTSFERARKQLFNELKLLGIGDWNVILSTNIPLRRDGMPYAGQANPKDPGVAVYFKHKNRPMVFACDNYIDVTDNLYAITKTIEALRGIQRWGASDMLERSFTGFTALPPAQSQAKQWWEILGVSQKATADEIGKAWRTLAQYHHPDKGGTHEMMAKINGAYKEGMGVLP